MSWTADESQLVVGGENSTGKWEENKDPVRFMSFFFRGCKLAASRRGSHLGPPGDRPIYFFQAPPLCIPHLASSAPLHSYLIGSTRQPHAAQSCVTIAPPHARAHSSPHARTHARASSRSGALLAHIRLGSGVLTIQFPPPCHTRSWRRTRRDPFRRPEASHDSRPTLHSLHH